MFSRDFVQKIVNWWGTMWSQLLGTAACCLSVSSWVRSEMPFIISTKFIV